LGHLGRRDQLVRRRDSRIVGCVVLADLLERKDHGMVAVVADVVARMDLMRGMENVRVDRKVVVDDRMIDRGFGRIDHHQMGMEVVDRIAGKNKTC